MKKVLFFSTFLLAFSACTQFSSEYKRTKQENDSLKLHILQSETEMNDLLSILNAVETDIQAIRISEDLLIVQKDTELSASRREKLITDISLINETLKKNRQKLAELQEKLNVSSLNISALQKSIDRLTAEMNEKSDLIVRLRSELGKKDEKIEGLSIQIEGLQADMKDLEEISLSKTSLINEQDQELNMVYYCFGTKKELKEQNILTGGGVFTKSKTLQGNFNADYFLTVDKRLTSSIPLYSSKATIKTNHPAGSYHFVKDRDGYLTLEITQSAVFWSLSHYLVIEVR